MKDLEGGGCLYWAETGSRAPTEEEWEEDPKCTGTAWSVSSH